MLENKVCTGITGVPGLVLKIGKRVMRLTRLEKRLVEQRTTQRKRTWLVIASMFVFMLAVGASYFFFSGQLDKTKRTGGMFYSSNKINLLVLGVDERSGDAGRSDTIFAVTIDTGTKEVSMLSIPRDTRTKIPGYGWDKINHAYANGGHRLSLRTAEELLGINFDYYAVVNFASFYKIVDAVGGVDIDVEKRMYYEDPYDNLVIDINPGLQHMNGKTAIKYVRYRDADGDIGRIERQQKFIKAMLKQVASPGVIVRIPAIIKEVSSSIQTDMSTAEMLNVAKIINEANKNGLKTDMVPGRPAYIRDVSYWLPDIVSLRQHIAQTQGGTLDSRQLAEAERVGGEFSRSIPKEMTIVEVPKAVEAAKPGADDKKGDKPDAGAAKTAKPPQPPKNSIAIVNASGDKNAGAKMAEVLREKGFEVAGVTTGATVANNTVVISYSTSGSVVNKLTGLPFKYVLQISRDDSKSTVAAVVIGKDFATK